MSAPPQDIILYQLHLITRNITSHPNAMTRLLREHFHFYPWMCVSVVPLRCHVAIKTPQLPHLCWISFVWFMTYGRHPRQSVIQRAAPQTLKQTHSQSKSFVYHAT